MRLRRSIQGLSLLIAPNILDIVMSAVEPTWFWTNPYAKNYLIFAFIVGAVTILPMVNRLLDWKKRRRRRRKRKVQWVPIFYTTGAISLPFLFASAMTWLHPVFWSQPDAFGIMVVVIVLCVPIGILSVHMMLEGYEEWKKERKRNRKPKTWPLDHNNSLWDELRKMGLLED